MLIVPSTCENPKAKRVAERQWSRVQSVIAQRYSCATSANCVPTARSVNTTRTTRHVRKGGRTQTCLRRWAHAMYYQREQHRETEGKPENQTCGTPPTCATQNPAPIDWKSVYNILSSQASREGSVVATPRYGHTRHTRVAHRARVRHLASSVRLKGA